MLKLKKLQILGFKSFCDRTELKFHGDGVAGIIGPNGCGKSNISDAITWVLGEQSAKSLRGELLPWDIEFGFENGQLRLFQIRKRCMEFSATRIPDRFVNRPGYSSLRPGSTLSVATWRRTGLQQIWRQ